MMKIILGIFLILFFLLWFFWLNTSISEIKEKLSNIEEILKEQKK